MSKRHIAQREAAFARKLRALRPIASRTMWAEYIGLARMWARVPNGSRSVAWALDGARQCREHIAAARR